MGGGRRGGGPGGGPGGGSGWPGGPQSGWRVTCSGVAPRSSHVVTAGTSTAMSRPGSSRRGSASRRRASRSAAGPVVGPATGPAARPVVAPVIGPVVGPVEGPAEGFAEGTGLVDPFRPDAGCPDARSGRTGSGAARREPDPPPSGGMVPRSGGPFESSRSPWPTAGPPSTSRVRSSTPSSCPGCATRSRPGGSSPGPSGTACSDRADIAGRGVESWSERNGPTAGAPSSAGTAG